MRNGTPRPRLLLYLNGNDSEIALFSLPVRQKVHSSKFGPSTPVSTFLISFFLVADSSTIHHPARTTPSSSSYQHISSRCSDPRRCLDGFSQAVQRDIAVCHFEVQ